MNTKTSPRLRTFSQKECVVHSFAKHGKEAEELRVGIEALIHKTDPSPEELTIDEARDQLDILRQGLIELLDDVDARDSLAYLERKLEMKSAKSTPSRKPKK